MSRPDELREAAALQARLCREAGSFTYAAVIEAAATRLDEPLAVSALLLEDERHPVRSALFLRLLGAVHRLVLDDPRLPLGALYPTAGGTADAEAAVPAFFDLVEHRRDAVREEMQVDEQTNRWAGRRPSWRRWPGWRNAVPARSVYSRSAPVPGSTSGSIATGLSPRTARGALRPRPSSFPATSSTRCLRQSRPEASR